MDTLAAIVEEIRAEFTAKNEARERALQRSRELVRLCAKSIRATHRTEYAETERLLGEARKVAQTLSQDLKAHPDLYYAGYTQDALKELVEACLVYAVVNGQPLTPPAELGVPAPAYINGLAEAASELRRHVLDLIRRADPARAEAILQAMDDMIDQLVTIDFPDAITGGLRRNTDQVRAVLERTRGDLTLIGQQALLRAELQRLQPTAARPALTADEVD